MSLENQVKTALNNIRPYLQADGGDVEFVKITEDMVVHIRLLGNCRDCHISEMTMKAGIEEGIKSAVPAIKSVQEIK
jgi:Fe-S cluster biogenesis protein NfuA